MLPVKFLFSEPETPQSVEKFEKQLLSYKIPDMLFERLTNEF